MQRIFIILFSFIFIQFIACSGENSDAGIEEVTIDSNEIKAPKREINLYDGARFHIAHVGQDIDQRVYYYKESCDFNPFVIDVLTSESGGQQWDLLIHSESIDKRYLLDEFNNTDEGLSLTLKDGDKIVSATMGFTNDKDVYSFYMEGVNDTMFVFHEEHVNHFDIMSCYDIKQIMKHITGRWYYTSKIDGERVIFEECRYGTSYIAIEESFVEFSGGGDARSFDLREVDKSYDNITLYYSEMGGELMQMMIEDGDQLIVKFTRDNQSGYYVADRNKHKVKVVEESPCDE